MSVKQLVETAISSNKVVLFSKSYCPYCIKAKDILKSKGAVFELFELDQINNGSEIQSYLAEKTGQRTVPNIFIQTKHVGGCSDLQAAQSNGSLDKLLQ